MPELRQEYVDILEKREWSVSSYTDDGRVEIEWYSPAGEDFIICVGVEKFPDEVLDYSDSFDIDEHIAMWIEAKQSGTQGVPGARQIVHDAEEIEKELDELAFELRRQKENYGLQVLQHLPPADGGRHPVPERPGREHHHHRQLRGGPDVLQGHRPARVGLHRVHGPARPAAGL